MTTEQLRIMYPSSTLENRKVYASPLTRWMEQYGITTKARKRCFLAQIGVESGQLKYVRENLNYSAHGLLSTFPKYFNQSTAPSYARKPEKIANRVYAGRLGNGNEASGDGWKFRGRGLIQITGRSNYEAAMKGMVLGSGMDLLECPDYLCEPEWAVASACWWWKSHGLNEMADKITDSASAQVVMKAITKKINGGYNGWLDRWSGYRRACSVIV